MVNNKKLNLIDAKLFIIGRKLNICLIFITELRRNMHYFVMKIPNKRELQQIVINHCKTLTLQILEKSTRNHSKTIFFQSMIQLDHQTFLYILGKIF